jgi:N utilization substance protein B
MGSRRKAREVALQLLYQNEFNPGGIEESLGHFWREGELDDKAQEFARGLVQGALAKKELLDRLISESSENWRLNRMAIIDRNIMRLAVYEFLFTPDTPKKVVINEAIEIAKRFGTEDSTQFINGILDNIRKQLEAKAS